MSRVGDRILAGIDDNFELVVAALLVVALAGGYLAYTGYTADERTKTQTVSSWESQAEFSHSATVETGTDAFPEGTVLRDRRVYFSRVAPVLDGSFEYGYRASRGGNLTAETSLTLVMHTVEESETGNVTEYWRVEEPLENARATSLEPGETVRVRFSQNVTAAARRATRIADQLGNPPGETEVLLQARVRLSGPRNGEPVDRTRVYELPISVERGVYRVEDPGLVTDSGSTRERVTVSTGRDLGLLLGGGAVSGLALAAAVGLVVARRRGDVVVDEATRERLAFASERSEFDDWITIARLPAVAHERPRIEVDSLAGLVDLAIDTDERVIETPSETFHVLHDEFAYVYEPPGSGDGADPGSRGLADTDGENRDSGVDASTSDAAEAEDASAEN